MEQDILNIMTFTWTAGLGEGIVSRVWGRREAEVPRLVGTFSALNFRSATWMSSTVASSAVFPDLPPWPPNQ